ncbi:MAG: MFS transporter [Bifidobacteriaceae bacterium]|nr:MFS transporter [Bifidobacteriaceae bacterium]
MKNLNTLIVKIFLPAALYEIAIGAITPMIAIAALNLQASVAVASVVAALLGVGQIVGDIPAGKLATAHGDRLAMIYGSLGSFVCLVLCFFAPNYFILGLGIFFIGGINAIFMLARQGYVIEITPEKYTSRALSTLGGMTRIGLLAGPFLGSATISVWGLNSIYILSIIIVVLTLITLLAFTDVDSKTGKKFAKSGAKKRKVEQKNISSRWIFQTHRNIFFTLGLTILIIGAIRAIRQVGIPLWSQSQGISESDVSLIFGISSLFDCLLFYPSALIMDHFGRLWSSVPSMLIMAAGLAWLPFTHSFASICICSIVIGIGNGLGTGIIMTLAADVAPPEYRANFLGLWRIFSDSGNAIGPLLVSVGTTALTLGTTIFISSFLGVAAVIMLFIFAPKYSKKANLVHI